jgi:short subunit dehydrogenase-like uncharacterized protein
VTEREYDVVLYGATGFTGRQTVAYLAAHADASRVRWAIAGRSRERLERVRADVGAPGPADVIVADAADQRAVDAMAARTRVLLTTAGPFAVHGTPIVDACVRARTHYVDITGETAWVRDLVAAYHERAAAEGTRVVPFCGFDSVPSDLGTLLVVRHLRESLGAPCAEARGYFRLRGGLNGGTIATSLNVARSRPAGAGDRFLLDPPVDHSARQRALSRDATAPAFDEVLGTWTAPFVMAPMNTRVVRRSAALHALWGQPYGPDFVYREFMRVKGRSRALAVTAGLGAFAAALRSPLGRRLVERLMPKPGEGPSPARIRDGWFSTDLVALADDGRAVRGRIRHAGDPGNHATVRFVCESALALALDGDALPGGPSRGGVLTPATALGDALARRIRAAGTEITVG